jgi:Ca-activated chloride channel family protein
VSPLDAAKIAQAMKVKIYTIGAGSKGPVPYPVQDMWGRKMYQEVQLDLDEDTLKQIATLTSAKYFRATDTESLREIYKEIDALEKTKIEHAEYTEYKELFSYFLLTALMLILIETILTNSVLMRIP